MAVVPPARTAAGDVEVVVVEPRAIISWSSILAGALIALAVLVLLERDRARGRSRGRACRGGR